MSWIEFVPVVLVASVVVYLPGLLIAWSMGARGFTMFGLAPAVSVGVIGGSAIVLDRIGVPWGPVPVLIIAVVIAAALFVIRRGWKRRPVETAERRGRTPRLWLWLSVVSGSVIIGVQMVIVLVTPDSVSQTFDALFHLNALRYIADTGSASSFHITSLILPPGRSSFYPAAWHGMGSLVIGLSGAPITAAANAVNVVVATLVWVSGCVLLTRTVFPGSRSALAVTGVIAAAFPGFPLLPLGYGVLYPYFLGLALIPVGLAIALSYFRLAGGIDLARGWHVPAVAMALVGMGLAQPSAALACCALIIPLALAWVIRVLRDSRPGWVKASAVLAVTGSIGVLAVGWFVASRIGVGSPWQPHASPLVGLFETFGHAPVGRPAAVVVSILVVIGLIDLIVRRDKLWLVLMWSIGGGLYFVSAVVTSLRVRNLLVGLFYSNPPRLGALMIMVSVPVAVAGAVALIALARRVLANRPLLSRIGSSPRLAVAGSVAAGLVLLTVGTQGPAMGQEIRHGTSTYRFDPAVLSADENELIERLPSEVDESAVIAGSGWTGPALAYALADRQVLAPHFNVSNDPRKVIVNTRLNQALTDPTVCPAVEELNVEYVLDFGHEAGGAGGGVPFDGLADYPGLAELDDSGVVTLVDQEGEAKLFRVSAC